MNSSNKFAQKVFGLLILTALSLTACNIPAVSTNVASNETLVEETPIIEDGELAAEDSTETVSVESETEVVMVVDEQASATVNANGLTDAEVEGLLYMREEEKLARDVYLALYDMWGLNIFQNIADSEQTHTDAVKGLLDKFGIADPAEDTAAGVFTDATLQALYDELTGLGAQSLEDAIRVGAAIEEIDILDLQEYLSTLTNDSIRQVYENLLSGSENHLRAFVSTLAQKTGETYVPQYLGEEDYNTIMSESTQNNAPTKGGGMAKGRKQ